MLRQIKKLAFWLYLLVPAAFVCPGCAKKFNVDTTTAKLTIDSISPASGQAGTPVLIYGQGFSAVAAGDKVAFLNGLGAKVDSNASFNVLRVYAPDAPYGGSGPVTLVVNGDSVTGPAFTYEQSLPAPEIDNIIFDKDLVIYGNNFDTQHSIVTIDGLPVPGFQLQSQQELRYQAYQPPAEMNNPAPIFVTVNGAQSNTYSYLFTPQITGFSSDTAIGSQNITITGSLFGNQTAPGKVRAWYPDANFNMIYMSPDPAIVSWTGSAIVVTMPVYSTYPTGRPLLAFDINLEVDVSTSGSSQGIRYVQ